ncbi:hypothetical protein BCR33DRAFT_130476 [Rhizoclosmatium globosum]|uniref:Uncharacterized protein n=1 Tax=Rhizoclosmatium globosum TaxID=329046 RepID=A0A1Y2CI75_9FUNG|nr:hypothetical protein BCR33DRAFT_130476 [Rhizoclosmatium globosum]|eukprot:ORY46524.1 hypothetical protein BCR33DRAFT_130476 [Rhizoclosmatium globosum]
MCGFNMPDDFSWERSGTKGASLQLELGSFSPAIAQPKQPAGVSSNSTGGVKMLMSKPVKAMDFGDGTELDFLDDISEADSVPVPSQTPPLHPIPLKAWAEQPESLPSSPKIPVISQIPVIRNVSLTSKPAPKQETAIRKPAPTPARPALSGLLASSLRRSDTNLNRWTNSIPQPPPKKQKKKPTLIRNVNPADIAHVIGKMVYDPILQKWTGNEEALLDFDKESSGAPSAPPSPQKPRHRPALITNRSGLSHIPHVVGKMVFDPEKMCWVGNDEDADVFAGLDDAFGSSETDQDTQKYFTLTKAMKQSLYVAESSHKLFIGKWYPKAVQEAKTLTRDTSKSHLYDIRTMSVRL